MNYELKEIATNDKLKQQTKINEILKNELLRKDQEYNIIIQSIKKNYREEILKIKNEHEFNINSIKLEYNNLKHKIEKKNLTWSEYILHILN